PVRGARRTVLRAGRGPPCPPAPVFRPLGCRAAGAGRLSVPVRPRRVGSSLHRLPGDQPGGCFDPLVGWSHTLRRLGRTSPTIVSNIRSPVERGTPVHICVLLCPYA